LQFREYPRNDVLAACNFEDTLENDVIAACNFEDKLENVVSVACNFEDTLENDVPAACNFEDIPETTFLQLAMSVPKTIQNHRGQNQLSMDGGVPRQSFSSQNLPQLPVVSEQTRHKLHVPAFPQNSLACSRREA
jgi:hypothetical protein